jgi:hypothetical protein
VTPEVCGGLEMLEGLAVVVFRKSGVALVTAKKRGAIGKSISGRVLKQNNDTIDH